MGEGGDRRKKTTARESRGQEGTMGGFGPEGQVRALRGSTLEVV